MTDNFKYETEGIHNLQMPPPSVGEYQILGHLSFHFPKKPNWFHRMMTRLLLGWVWIDHDV
jgi:hypothetical protein